MSTLPLSSDALQPAPRAPMNFQSRGMKLNDLRRRMMNHLVTGLAIGATVAVIIPLIAILFYLVYKGFSSLNLNFFTKIPAPVGEAAVVWRTQSLVQESCLDFRV